MGLHKPKESLGQRRVLLRYKNASLCLFAVLGRRMQSKPLETLFEVIITLARMVQPRRPILAQLFNAGC